MSTVDALLRERRGLFGGSLRVSYAKPLHIVRGRMQYLYDPECRQYLDAYNNVPHVGHCHPRVVEAGQKQMAELNTNTRYLHENLNDYAARLIATLPSTLKVCFFVNSGSEANELALRLARAHTKSKGLIVLEHAYHGNTTTLVDISPYKFNGPGGEGPPSWVHTARLPDLYRGPNKRNDLDAGKKYAQDVEQIVKELSKQGKGLSGFIAESWPSVGGQMDLPRDYLPAVYRAVKAAGGVCIADEIQTGYGRVGTHFWGFEAYGVVPDIVAIGKPIGNGYPIGAVITTVEIAASFDNGMEFFSTFGGSTVGSAVGREVLQVVLEEDLQAHALKVGDDLLDKLRQLQTQHSLIGDVRGSGLFVGVELVSDRDTIEPATKETNHVVNQLRNQRILVGSDGPYQNVLKIRPPMPFTTQNTDELVQALHAILSCFD